MKPSFNRRRFLADGRGGERARRIRRTGTCGSYSRRVQALPANDQRGRDWRQVCPNPILGPRHPRLVPPGHHQRRFVPARFCAARIKSSQLTSFRDLPRLVAQAKSLGTEAIYLVDWYEGPSGSRPESWWGEKGDYIPRGDLGGAAALKDGIAAVHALGARIIFYVEGFIITKTSTVGKRHGAAWSIIGKDNKPIKKPYPGSWKLCPAAEGCVEYFESVARRMGQYGADGIFIDSYGYQRDWECVSRKHKHPLASKEVFNAGAARLLARVRTALQSERPEAIILVEGPLLEKLFAHTDGSLDWGIHTLVRRWLWDAQGKTDTITTGFSIDDWHQILAIGGKLACPAHFLQAPPYSSATALLDVFLKRSVREHPERLALEAFRNLHQWRNAGLILGLPMPGLEDLCPRVGVAGANIPDPLRRLYKDRPTLAGVFEGLRPRAAAINAAFAGRRPIAPAAYIKTLLTARRSLAKFIDHGSSVAHVNSGNVHAAAWRFSGVTGAALTAVNVADVPCRLAFPNTTGTWTDGVSGDKFTAQGTKLTVSVLAHGIRLLFAG